MSADIWLESLGPNPCLREVGVALSKLLTPLTEGPPNEGDIHEAWRIVAHALDLSLLELLSLDPDFRVKNLSASQIQQLASVCQRRIRGEPLSRIKGARAFWKGTFALSPDTLDPRPETEGLIDLACAFFPSPDRQMRILDLGTGTGCLLISLLLEFPQGRGWGVDCAPGAVAVAQENARRHGIEDRCVILQGDWLTQADHVFDHPFDLIVSNPPYIPTQDIQTLAPEVKGYDPVGALDGGQDGLDAFRAIIPAASRHLKPGGAIMLECGIHQEHAVTHLLDTSFHEVRFFNDLAGIPRYAQGSQPRR